MTQMTLYKNGDRPFYCTTAQAETLDRLAALNKGGIGSVHGYKPTTGYVAGKEPTVNLQILTRFETGKLYARKRAAVEAIQFSDIAEDIAKNPKLKVAPIGDLMTAFNERKAKIIESLSKTLDGDRSDAHREGHDRCYVRVADGVKVNLDCEKVDGLMQPKMTQDGFPTAESIMLHYLELNRTEVVPGERKVVNSGVPVLIEKAIERQLNMRSVGIKTLSLKGNNFESLNVAKQSITPDDLKVKDDNRSKLVALLEACGFKLDDARVVALLEGAP